MKDDFTRLKFMWLNQVNGDRIASAASGSSVAFQIASFFNRKHFDESGVFKAWPSHDTIAKKIGCSAKTVQRAISRMKSQGHLQIRGKGGRNVPLTYFAIVKAVTERIEPAASKAGRACPPFEEDCEIESGKVDSPAPKGGHPTTQKLDKDVQGISLAKSLINLSERTPRESKTAREGATQGEADAVRAPVTHVTRDKRDIDDDGHKRSHRADPSGIADGWIIDPTKAEGAVAILSELMNGPGPLPPLPPIVRRDPRPEWLMDHQANHGWPDLLDICRNADRYSAVFGEMAWEMEIVQASKDNPLWSAWTTEYRRRGWPLPKPANDIAFFPFGGPKALDAFQAKLEARMRDENILKAGNIVRLAG